VTGRAARQAADALHRGVVSISSTLDEIAGDGASPDDAVPAAAPPGRLPRDVP
jgi:hypothetical protein